MKTDWDYTHLADAYLKRPDYAPAVIDDMIRRAGIRPGAAVCDVGAGVAHLTIMLAERGLRVTAVEPNDAMRANGMRRTQRFSDVHWVEGTGENTHQPSHAFELATFGSSFNVCDRARALAEADRILVSRGWFACMWNHRDIDDPIQARIEGIIRDMVPGYDYGTRREDQAEVIAASGLFEPCETLSGRIEHTQGIDDCVEAWRSHATLARQAGPRFAGVVDAIEAYLRSLGGAQIQIPYRTNLWMARKTA